MIEEEKHVLKLITCYGWEEMYCYFNNVSPYNCLAKKIRCPANSDSNGMVWICDGCLEKMIKRIGEEK